MTKYIFDKNKKGGLARIRIHGNPGTPGGRSLGGLRSLQTHKEQHTAFKTLISLKEIPRKSTALAELFGILAGDGHVGDYQVSVTTNSLTDMEHARHTAFLLSAFGLPVSFRLKKNQNACVVYVSSKSLSKYLVTMGLVSGNKVHSQLSMPGWISENQSYADAFIRGIFDTDGCVYVDKHRSGDKIYGSTCLMFSNRSLPLLEAFKNVLVGHGLHPTQKTKYAVFLRRRKEVASYFKIIGSSNPKHVRRYAEFA